MNIIERSIRQPVAVSVAVLLLVIFGLLGFFRVPVQLTPNVDEPVVTVSTRWIGAMPQEIEREVIQEQEEKLKTVNGLRQMTSQSNEGEGTIRLVFHVGVNKTDALNEVRDKLGQVRDYPPDVDKPVVEAVDRFSRDYVAWVLVRPVGGAAMPVIAPNARPGFSGNITELQDFMEDEVKPVLERAEGVAEVNVLGGREREMQVRVDLEKLAARGITVADFTAALRGENLDATAGAIRTGKYEASVRAIGQYTDPEQILNTVIAWTRENAPVYVRDVAAAQLSFKRQAMFVRSKATNVLALNVQRETGTNVLEVMANLKAAIREANEHVLKPTGWGIELHQVYDQSVYVERAVKQATDDLLLGAGLAAAVLFLTLRSVGATLVVAVSIPVSVIGTFLGMYITGRNLNVISMAGLSFAIGMGVDNTIVVLENIFRHREMGKDRFQAALDGTREVWGAIMAATLANIAVFLPVMLIQEEAGQLFQDISVAISISLMLYMLVSPTVIPMLATRFLRRMPGGFIETQQGMEERAPTTILGRLTRPISRAGAAMSEVFYNFILWLTAGVVRRLVLVLVMVGGASYLSWALIPPRTYLPPGNQNMIFGMLSTPPGYSMEELRSMGHGVEAQLAPWWSVAEGSAEHKQLQTQWVQMRDQFAVPAMRQTIDGMKAGMAAQGMPKSKIDESTAILTSQLQDLQRSAAPPTISEFFFVAHPSGVFMGAISGDMDNVAPLQFLFGQSTRSIPGTFPVFFQMPIFRVGGFGTGIEVSISGLDNERVRNAAAAVQGMLMGKFQRFVRAEPANFQLGRPEMQIVPNRVRAAAAAVPTPVIREAARVVGDGAIIGDYRYAGRAIDLTVITDTKQNQSIESLRDVPVVARNGRIVPLGSVADFIDTSAPTQINRMEEQPAVMLMLNLLKSETVQQVDEAIESQVIAPLRQAGVIGPGLNVRRTGSADKLDQFIKAFIPGFTLAAVITYLLLAALFESWLHPLVIIMSVPFALVGGFMGLAILHYTSGVQLDVLTMLGFVILIGTIVNNPILIVHQALNYLREGMDRRHAIALSTQTRVRPIFMSVITSVAGMAPLVVFGGAGSELYRGLGAVVVGGLLLSTVFTLFLTPALMSLMLDLQAGVRRLFWSDEPPQAPRKGESAGQLEPLAVSTVRSPD
jgi:HAE1 family hydrophobic/amphiphilic exporter-1